MRRDDLCDAIRERLERLPEPFANHYGVIPPPPPEQAIVLSDVRRSHQRATEALAQAKLLAQEFQDPFVVSRLLTRREAVSSSAIEGTNSTLDELLTVEETGAEARDAALQVRDYARALEQIIPRASNEGTGIFTLDLVRSLHREAMKNDPDYPDIPGEWRKTVVWIGGVRNIAYSTYNPAPPKHVQSCLEETMRYMRAEGMQIMTQSLITRMAVAHAHFEAVHPFRDGNGRAGRLLLPLMMAADGEIPLYLSPYIEVHKDDYYASLKAAQQKLDWATAAAFMADAISGTVAELLLTRKALKQLEASWARRRKFRSGSTAVRSLDLLSSYPVITAKRLGELLKVSYPAATTAIEQLSDAGILQEKTGYKRNRVFVAPEVLTIINRPFGEDPPEFELPLDG